MRNIGLMVLTVALILQPVVLPTALSPASARIVDNPTVTPDGLLWDQPTQVVSNNLDDSYPTIAVDPKGNAHIVYLQSGQDYRWAKVDASGSVVNTEKLLTTGFIPMQYQVKNESTEQPTSHMDVDSKGNLHIVWTMAGLLDNRYQRFDPTGEPDTPVMLLNQITMLSRLPYLVVGNDDRAYIAYESEGTAWVQMTYITAGGLLQAPALIGRPGENVAYTIDDDGYVHIFYRSLGADVSMWYAKLDPDRDPAIKPRVIFPNTSKIANPASSMPTLTTTPNGHVHLLLSDITIAPHPIWYIELDGAGKVVHNWSKIVEGAHNFGDIVGCRDNSVMVFWDDFADGEVHYLRIADGAPGQGVRISETGGNARFPQADLGKYDDVHLTYSVYDGYDNEVYYRYANNFIIELDIDGFSSPIEVRPGEHREIPVTITNVAEFPNQIDFVLDVDLLEHTGWEVSSDLDGLSLSMAPGEKKAYMLDCRVPAAGEDGELISVTITATPKNHEGKSTSLRIDYLLKITRSLIWEGTPERHLGEYDDNITIGLRNDGDVVENVTISVLDSPAGWTVVAAPAQTIVGPALSEDIIFQVSVPTWVETGTAASVTVEARSVVDQELSWPFEFLVHVRPDVFLYWEGPTHDTVIPNGTASFPMTLYNIGTESTPVIIDSRLVSGTGSWSTTEELIAFRLGAGEDITFEAKATAPPDAEAGSRLVFELVAYAEGVEAVKVLTVDVVEMSGPELVVVDWEDSAVIRPGQTAYFKIWLRNPRNVPLERSLSVEKLPVNWRWSFLKGNEQSPIVTLPPFGEGELRLKLSSPWNASPMQFTTSAIIGEGDERIDLEIQVTVQGRIFDLALSALQTHKWVDPGNSTSFEVTLENKGNGDDNFTIHLLGIPCDWAADFPGTIGLAAGETRVFNIEISVPSSTRNDVAIMEVKAISISQLIDRVSLRVEVRLPDLRISNWAVSKKNIDAGEEVEVTVEVSNDGTFATGTFVVRVNGAVQETSTGPGEKRELTFKVKPEPGKNNIVMIADDNDDVPEKDEGNNLEFDEVEVKSSGIPGFGLFELVLASTVALVLYALISRRCRS